MTTNRPLRVFLCHSSNDKLAVPQGDDIRELYQKLRTDFKNYIVSLNL